MPIATAHTGDSVKKKVPRISLRRWMNPRGSLSIRTSLLLLIGGTVGIILVVIPTLEYRRHKASLISGVDEKLLVAAHLAHAIPSRDYFDRIGTPGNPVSTNAFLEVVDRNNRLCEELDLQYLWSCMLLGEDIVFTTATSPSKDVTQMDHAGLLEKHRDPGAFGDIFTRTDPVYSSFKNEWGHGRMVLVPFKDRQDRAYCVGASLAMRELDHLLRDCVIRGAISGAVVLGLGLIGIALVFVILIRPILRLTRTADRMAHGDLDAKIVARGCSEVESLGESFDTMRQSIQEKIASLGSEIEERRKIEGELERHRSQLEELVKQRTAQLEQSNRDLEQFAYVASHDLQEPLRKIHGFAALFVARHRDRVDEAGQKQLAVILDGVERMQHLIMDLLQYSRVGRQELNVAPMDLNAVVDAVVNDCDELITTNRATITVGELPTLPICSSLMRQVFQNLITNAIKFRREVDPVVEIEAQRRADDVVFSIKDNGMGIEEDYIDEVFEVFKRLHSRGQYAGSGIGLSVVRTVIERHGGSIWGESKPGTGTTFFFTLPLESNQMAKPDEATGEAQT